MDSEVEQRIGATSKVIGFGMAVIGKRELSQKTKMRIVNAMVISTLTYGCETEESGAKDTSHRDASLKESFRETIMDRLKNEEIREKLQQEGVLEKVKRRQMSWREKLEEMSEERKVKQVFLAEVEGRRP